MFKEDIELDVKLMILAKESDGSDDPAKTYDEGAKALGLSGRFEGLMRGLWHLKEATPEYRDKVSARLKEVAPDYSTNFNPNGLEVKEVVFQGRKAIQIMGRGNAGALKHMGIEDTPEMVEFITQLSHDAVLGGPLSKPYIEAGAMRVRIDEVSPGIMAGAVDINNEKFAKMLKSPQSHMN